MECNPILRTKCQETPCRCAAAAAGPTAVSASPPLRLLRPPPRVRNVKVECGVESERKDKWRRKITAVLRTNDRTNERRTTTKTCPPSPPSSLPHSLAPAAMDGWHGGIDMPRFAMPAAPFEEIGLTGGRLCLRRRHGRNKQCQGQDGRRSAWQVDWAGSRCRGWPMRKKGLTHTR